MKRTAVFLISAFLIFVLFGCKKKAPQVTIEMEKGNIVIELFHKDAPKTVENFLKLTSEKFYDGLTFHRVVPGFVVQGGDPRGNGSGDPGYTIKFESSGRMHEFGSVAMARKKSPDSAGCQFYICLAPQPDLDGKYSVFGQVISGMEVVEKIARGDIMKRVYISSN